MSVNSTKGAGVSQLPSPTAINPNARPLCTYETKMAAGTAKGSILTILRKIGVCESLRPANLQLRANMFAYRPIFVSRNGVS